MPPEAAARRKIDDRLAAAGWAVQDYKAFNPGAARGIALREVPVDSGRCDYLLLVDRIPLGVIEAKKEGTTLSTVADQSAHYGEHLPDFLANLLPGTKKIPFAYESTGTETLFRDVRDPHPRSRRVFAFHQPATLAAWLAEPDTLRARLQRLGVEHPLVDGANGTTNNGNGASSFRACQVEAITKLEASFATDRPRALIQMATGAGKTYTACAFTYRLIKFAGARRVLFLVDRANLGKQAKGEFDQFVAPDTGRKFTEVYNVQHLILEPFAESVRQRFDLWIERKATKGAKFSAEQQAWLELMRDQIATSVTIEPDDFGYSPFVQRGGFGKAHQLFGEQLPNLLNELNVVLAA